MEQTECRRSLARAIAYVIPFFASWPCAAVQLVSTSSCISDETSWCIEGSFEPGRQVTVLGADNCIGKTSHPHDVGDPTISIARGTLLSGVHCKTSPASGEFPAVLDLQVSEYHNIPVNLQILPASDVARSAKEKVVRKKEFKEFYGFVVSSGSVFDLGIRIKNKEAYLVTQLDAGQVFDRKPAFLVMGNNVQFLTDQCMNEHDLKVFQINKNFFLEYSAGACGTDGAVTTFLSLD